MKAEKQLNALQGGIIASLGLLLLWSTIFTCMHLSGVDSFDISLWTDKAVISSIVGASILYVSVVSFVCKRR